MTKPEMGIDLGFCRELVAAESAADAARRFHEAEAKKYARVRDECRSELRKRMGVYEVGLVNGKEVLKRTMSEQFAPTRFRTEQPDIAAEYTIQEVKDVIDVKRLRKDLPDLAARYSTETWTNNWGDL